MFYFVDFFFHTDFGVKFKINSNSSLIFFFFFLGMKMIIFLAYVFWFWTHSDFKFHVVKYKIHGLIN